MSKYLKLGLKILLGIVIFLVILLLGIYLFIQTETFNKWALEYTLSEVNESWKTKENNVTAESLTGNILKGLRLNNGVITVKEDTLVSFHYLDLKYDLRGLLEDEIRLDYVILNSPKINLIKMKTDSDSLIWNFANLFSSSDEKDTTAGEFDWEVTVEKLKIENGNLHVAGVFDTIPQWQIQRQKLDTFDFNYLDVNNLELELAAKYFNDYKNLSLKNLSFNTNSDFNLRKLKFDANINIKDTVTDLWGFELVTDRTNARIDKLKMNQFNPFGEIVYEKFKDKDLESRIDIEKFNFADLNFFVPSLDILDSTAGVKLDASGKYGDLNVNNLLLTLPNSEIHFKGKIQSLHDPSNLYFDVKSDRLKITPADISLIYKDAAIPDYGYIGTVYADILYRGTLKNFYSEFDFLTQSGNAEGNVNLNLDYETYHGNVITRNLNIGGILNDRSLNSNLNSNVNFSGKGFSLNTISSKIDYSINNSSFTGYDIRSSQGNISANGKNFAFNIRHISSMGNALLNGRVNISNLNNPVYALRGRVNNLDISKFTKDGNDKSNLNLSFNINGRGSNVNNIHGTYSFDIGNSYYSTYQLPETPLNIEINNSGSSSRINVSSDLLDFKAEGYFRLSSITEAIQSNIASFSNNVKEKLNLDSIPYSASVPYYPVVADNFNVVYEMIVKDTAKLQQVLNSFGVKFNGDLKGKMSNDADKFSSEISVNINDFIYNDTSIVLKNVSSDFLFSNNYSSQDLNSLIPYSIDFRVNGEKSYYGNNSIDTLLASFLMQDAVIKMDVYGKQDSLRYAKLTGDFDLRNYELAAKFDTVSLKYNRYEVMNQNNWKIIYSPDQVIDFQEFAVKSKNVVLDVSGEYALNGDSDINIKSENLQPADVFELLNSLDSAGSFQNSTYPVEGNINFAINYKGNFDNPNLNVNINSDNLTFNDSAIGKVQALLDYKDEIAATDISLVNEKNSGSFKIQGNVPYANPFIEADTTSTNSGILQSPVTLNVIAKDFHVGDFAKLIPNMIDIDGIMNGEIAASGTVASPELKGKLEITDGRIYTDYTGMTYRYKFLASTENSMLKVNSLSISNEGDNSRHLDLYGNIDFKGFVINNIDLSTSGDVVLLDENAEENQLGIEGYFRGGVGSRPITIKGNLEKLDIEGQFLIKEATISSIPTKGSGYDAEADNFIYVLVPSDTMNRKLFKDTVIIVDEKDLTKINPFTRTNIEIVEDTASSSILNLNLNVKTEKNIFISIDFNNITRDRLFGEITANLDIKTVNNEINANGSVEVLKNSYYRFYKNFKIDKSRITFDGPISNPILDIQAVYEGTKVTEQFGTATSYPVEVVLTLKGQVDNPEINIKLIEDGTEISGNDAQADAITYLLFGRYKSELTSSERKTMASSVGTTLGSLYVTSFISQTVREVLPFIVDAQFKYSEGKVKDTDIELTSEFGDATVKVGGKLLKEGKNFEFAIDYPLNKLLSLNLPETLIIQISREEITSGAVDNSQSYNTGIRIAYKFKY